MHNLHRACENCAAFNGPNRKGEPTCWDLVSFGTREPKATDLCDGHMSVMENTMLDESLAAESELGGRIKAVGDFKHRMFATRLTTAQALARARYD